MEITIAEFKEVYLPELYERFQTELQKSLVGNVQDIAVRLNRQAETFVNFVSKYQKSVPLKVGEVQISLLYSSISIGEPQICISAYGMNKVLGDEILNIKFRCDWLFTAWKKYQRDIELKVEELHAEGYIRKAAIKKIMNESVPFLIYCLYAVTKYQLMEFDKVGGFEELLLTDDFRLTVGGYRDWSRTVYQKREIVDIFLREENESLKFCVFNGVVYNKKRFADLDLTHARFYECEFVHCEFENVIFADSIFEKCRIYHCSFNNASFYGASFRECTLKRNSTQEVSWEYEVEEQVMEDIYKDVEFLKCVNDGSIMTGESV